MEIDREEIIRCVLAQKCQLSPPAPVQPEEWSAMKRKYSRSRILQWFEGNPEEDIAPNFAHLPGNLQIALKDGKIICQLIR
jgi:hypothetical protein